MVKDFFIEIDEIKSIVFFLVITLARPLGFLTAFALINFTLKRGMLLRIAISIALGLPIMVANIATLNDLFATGTLFDRTFLPAKETIIGFTIGTLASLPFLAFKFAGHISDSYRAEGSNGLNFTGSETVTTGGLIMFLVLSLTFVANDGLWHLFKAFYSSYALWPIELYLPTLRGNAVMLVVDQLRATFLLMIRVGIPLLLLLILAEFFLIIASRIGRRYGFNSYNFHLKNLVFLAVLPIYVVYLVRVAEDVEGDILDATRLFSLVFQ
ncbi:MAG: flagellar biosynthetic protein FliR [Rhodobacter sp.]|nr:flagellar biosynthetic protein FliR [Rhodobacter sp.]